MFKQFIIYPSIRVSDETRKSHINSIENYMNFLKVRIKIFHYLN